MYFVMQSDGRENTYMEREPELNDHVELSMGIPWDVEANAIDLPFRFTMKVDENQEPRLYAYYPGSDLMQQRLVDVMQNAGVNNLQLFPTEVKRDGTGEEVPGYVTVNIVGRLAGASMSKSKASPIADVKYFQELTINPNKIRDLLILRLHESPMVVLVHEKVARAIEKGNFTGLLLQPVAESTDP